MSRIRILSLVAASAALLGLSACDDSSSSSGGGGPVGRWNSVSDDTYQGTISRDSTVLEFNANHTGSTYSIYSEIVAASGAVESVSEGRSYFTWATNGSSLEVTLGACEDKVAGSWQPGRECETGSVEKASYSIQGDKLILTFLGDEEGESESDTFYRMK